MFTCFLVGGNKYEFTLIGWIDGGIEGNASREVTINEPPSGGSCTASPDEGEPLDPSFQLKCEKFTDTERPLQYEFFYRKEEKDETLGSGLDALRSGVTFPSGLQIKSYKLDLYVKVSDSLGASEMVPFTSKIKVIHGWR